MKRLNVNNLLKLITLILLIALLIKDIVMLALGACFTRYGFSTFLLMAIVASYLYEDLEDYYSQKKENR